jgi:glycine/D-amino acid oxidase-like deaminating enzyme
MGAAEPSARLLASQRVVIIGAGIVGNNLAYHLTRLGEAHMTLLDEGRIPGGWTGHASNFIFPVDRSSEGTLNATYEWGSRDAP